MGRPRPAAPNLLIDPTAVEPFDLLVGEATWVPAGVPHRFLNRGDSLMRIYWVYGGRDVTRTITETGETFEHLSPSDRGGQAG